MYQILFDTDFRLTEYSEGDEDYEKVKAYVTENKEEILKMMDVAKKVWKFKF